MRIDQHTGYTDCQELKVGEQHQQDLSRIINAVREHESSQLLYAIVWILCFLVAQAANYNKTGAPCVFTTCVYTISAQIKEDTRIQFKCDERKTSTILSINCTDDFCNFTRIHTASLRCCFLLFFWLVKIILMSKSLKFAKKTRATNIDLYTRTRNFSHYPIYSADGCLIWINNRVKVWWQTEYST